MARLTVRVLFIDEQERKERDAKRLAMIDEHRKAKGTDRGFPPGWHRTDPLKEPGLAYYCPWFFDPLAWADPKHPEHERERARMGHGQRQIDDGQRHSIMSPHYFRDWATKRPPLQVNCPNGNGWIPDQWSSNGDGWKVEGDVAAGTLVCHPSILTSGYHGWLGHSGAEPGWFSRDVDRPNAPNGVYHDGTPA